MPDKTRKRHLDDAVKAYSDLHIFHGIVALLEGGTVSTASNSSANYIIRHCKTASAKCLDRYDAAIAKANPATDGMGTVMAFISKCLRTAALVLHPVLCSFWMPMLTRDGRAEVKAELTTQLSLVLMTCIWGAAGLVIYVLVNG